jgi:hypothetical protein
MSLEPRKSFILIKYFWVLPVILNVLYKCKLDIPISALLLELGWEPINAFLDRQRISYFSRFSELNSTRLCKQTFDELFIRCASDDGSHMEQPCAIHGRITEVHKAFPNSTLLNSPLKIESFSGRSTH